jgi:hypothetical protein
MLQSLSTHKLKTQSIPSKYFLFPLRQSEIWTLLPISSMSPLNLVVYFLPFGWGGAGWGGVAYSIDLLLDGKKQPENIGVITG